MNSLSKSITNLTLLDNFENGAQVLVKFVLMFKSLCILHIRLEDKSAALQLLRQLPLILKVLSIYSFYMIDISDNAFVENKILIWKLFSSKQ